MKCLILAGGKSQRLWPMARANTPVQFIPMQGDHSLFQETVARNLPFCDEFIIVTGYEYRHLIEEQMTAFQGTAYRCIFETEPLKTAAAVALGCRDLPDSELVFVVSCNHLTDPTSKSCLQGYQDAVLAGKALAKQERIVVFGLEKRPVAPYMGFIRHKGAQVLAFTEKPAAAAYKVLCEEDGVLRNSGMSLFEAGLLLREISRVDPSFAVYCDLLYRQRTIRNGLPVYGRCVAAAPSIEKLLFERTKRLAVVEAQFHWWDVTHPEETEERVGASAVQPVNQVGQIEPFVLLRPALKDYLWGGNRLKTEYGKTCELPMIAESWELSAHPAGQSMIASGKHKGMPLGSYLQHISREALGWKVSPGGEFPLLIKLIDAKEDLSVQVHPGDEYAMEHEGECGKNELWYVVDCVPGSGIYVGFNRSVTPQEVAQCAADGTIMSLLNRFETHPGDVFFIPEGTVHAIGGGNLICEVQQSSNSTYRIYDYQRRDKYGCFRPLHLDKALDVLHYGAYRMPQKPEQTIYGGRLLGRCKYFEAGIFQVQGPMELPLDSSSFAALVCLKGHGCITGGAQSQAVVQGQSFFVPAGQQIHLDGQMDLLVARV